MYNLVICDDDNEVLNYLSEKIMILNKFNIKCINSGTKLLEEIKFNKVDVILMDIEFNEDKNGIEIVKQINDENIEVVYITGYNKYCTDVYETKHTYFLVKPFKDIELKNALKKVLKNLKKLSRKYISIKIGTNYKVINLNDIYYIESDKRKIKIKLKDDYYEIYNTLPNIMKELTSSFVMCHKSFVVNLNKVRELSGTSFILSNNNVIPISQNKFKEVKSNFLNFVKEGK